MWPGYPKKHILRPYPQLETQKRPSSHLAATGTMYPPKKTTATTSKLDQYRRQEKDSLAKDSVTTREEETFVGTDTAKVLEAITLCQEAVAACQTTLTARIEEAKVDISLVREDFQKLRERVTEAEAWLSTVEYSLPPLQQSTEALQL